jgi:hypothetical protein
MAENLVHSLSAFYVLPENTSSNKTELVNSEAISIKYYDSVPVFLL